MTANLINFYSAKATDAHYNRMDTETKRYNQVLENLKTRELNEVNRHNLITESISQMSANTAAKVAQVQAYSAQEMAKYNRMMANIQQQRADWQERIDTIRAEETERYNRVQADLEQQRIDQYERLTTAAQAESKRHNEVTEAQGWTNSIFKGIEAITGAAGIIIGKGGVSGLLKAS